MVPRFPEKLRLASLAVLLALIVSVLFCGLLIVPDPDKPSRISTMPPVFQRQLPGPSTMSSEASGITRLPLALPDWTAMRPPLR